jgi:hypothetical protein
MSIDSLATQSELHRFGGTITREQFSLVQRLLLPWWGSMRFTALCIVIVAPLLNAGLGILNGISLEEFIFSMMWALAMIVFVWALVKFSLRRQWTMIQTTQPQITGNLNVNGLEWNTPMTTKFPWSKLVKIRQHPEMLLIFYSPKCAFYMPKQFFATESAWNEANAFALRQLHAKPRPT